MTRQDWRDFAPPLLFVVVLTVEQFGVMIYTDSNDLSPFFAGGAWLFPLWYFIRLVTSVLRGKHK